MQRSEQGKPASPWLATLATSLVYAAAHAPWSIAPLALVAVAPVSAVLLDRRSRIPAPRAALAGALFGALATWCTVGWWSWLAAREFFGGSGLRAGAFVAALPLFASGIALHYAAAFVLLSRLSGSGPWIGVLGSGAIWALAELARTSLGYGNPWASFASALASVDDVLAPRRPVAFALSIGGPELVAFVCGAVGASLGLAWNARRSAVGRGRAIGIGAIVVAAVFGVMTLVPVWMGQSERRLGKLRVALVQPGFGRGRLWEHSGAAESFDRHVKLSRDIEPGAADLIVWPESALPFLLDANAARRDDLRSLAKSLGAAVLAGGTRSVREGGRSSVYNSAFLFPADGSLPIAYDKRRLLPFLEHVPGWAAPLAGSAWQGAYSPGSTGGAAGSPDFFEVKGWRVAPLLCFEAIYPDVVVSRVAEGADLLVNLSNDSWFDEGAGGEQHFALARLAAAETLRPLVRAATSGVSAYVGGDGSIPWSLPPRESGIVVVDVLPPFRISPYVHGGRAAVTLLLVALAGGALLAARIARRDDEPRRGAQS